MRFLPRFKSPVVVTLSVNSWNMRCAMHMFTMKKYILMVFTLKKYILLLAAASAAASRSRGIPGKPSDIAFG